MHGNRRGFVGAGVGLLAGGITASLLQPTNERLDSLEAKVEALDNRVSTLEALEGPVGDEAGSTGTDDKKISDSEWLTISGADNTVTEKFTLEAGRYRVHATLEATGATGFIAMFYDPDGQQDLVFNALIDAAGEWTSEAIYNAATSGEYFIEVSNVMGGATWALAFEPF